jgi:glutamyl-tRNA synthetase
VIVDFYREIGFCPEAILNYLLLLGWSLDGEREKFTVEEMIQLFSLSRVNRAPASFDPQKLLAFQADALAALPLQQRVDLVTPFAQRAGFGGGDQTPAKLAEVVAGAGDRIKVAGDIIDFDYCFVDEIEYDQKAFQKRLIKPADACELLGQLRQHLSELDQYEAATLEQSVKDFCQQSGIGLGQIIHALRVATTGKPAGFGMFETLAVLGKERVSRRIDAALEHAATIRGDSDS